MSPLVGHVTLALYALLLAGGGIMGFARARSKASLTAGIVSALAAVVAIGLSAIRNPLGRPLGLLLAIVMFIFFGYRFATKNRKFMPNGLMAVVSLAVIALMMLLMLTIDEQIAPLPS